MLALMQRKRKSSFALFTNSETMDNGHWKFHKQLMLILVKGKTSLHKGIQYFSFQSGEDIQLKIELVLRHIRAESSWNYG